MVNCGHRICFIHPETEFIFMTVTCAKPSGHDLDHCETAVLNGSAGQRQITIRWTYLAEDDE